MRACASLPRGQRSTRAASPWSASPTEQWRRCTPSPLGVAALMAPGGERFAAHAAFYGPCIARFADPHTTGAPLLILYGTDDALIDPVRCRSLRPMPVGAARG